MSFLPLSWFSDIKQQAGLPLIQLLSCLCDGDFLHGLLRFGDDLAGALGLLVVLC